MELEQRAYNMRQNDIPWSQIHSTIKPGDLSQQGLATRTRRWAIKNNVQWPPPIGGDLPDEKDSGPNFDADPQLAYDTYAQGATWAEAAEASGYKNASTAQVCVKRYAEKEGLAWPIPSADNDSGPKAKVAKVSVNDKPEPEVEPEAEVTPNPTFFLGSDDQHAYVISTDAAKAVDAVLEVSISNLRTRLDEINSLIDELEVARRRLRSGDKISEKTIFALKFISSEADKLTAQVG